MFSHQVSVPNQAREKARFLEWGGVKWGMWVGWSGGVLGVRLGNVQIAQHHEAAVRSDRDGVRRCGVDGTLNQHEDVLLKQKLWGCKGTRQA